MAAAAIMGLSVRPAHENAPAATGRLDGDVGTRANRDTHIRSSERGRVIDAIAHHSHGTFTGQTCNLALFAFGQDTGNDFVHATYALNSPRRALVIARKHNRQPR